MSSFKQNLIIQHLSIISLLQSLYRAQSQVYYYANKKHGVYKVVSDGIIILQIMKYCCILLYICEQLSSFICFFSLSPFHFFKLFAQHLTVFHQNVFYVLNINVKGQ